MKSILSQFLSGNKEQMLQFYSLKNGTFAEKWGAEKPLPSIVNCSPYFY